MPLSCLVLARLTYANASFEFMKIVAWLACANVSFEFMEVLAWLTYANISLEFIKILAWLACTNVSFEFYGSPSMTYLCQCFPWVYGGPPLKTHCWPAPCLSWPGTYNSWSPYWSLYLHSLVLCKIKSNIKYFWPDIHSNLTSTNLCCLIGLVTPSYLCCSPTNPR